MYEASKSLIRRLHDNRFATRYFVGNGIDIGAGSDPLGQYCEQFPLMKSCRAWDMIDGDAQFIAAIDDEALDFVHSSHCLEHLLDPRVALNNWIRVLKPGGHLVVTVPDEDLYEQGIFPSTFNSDHKWTFTIHKSGSWSDKSLNIVSLLVEFSDQMQILKLERLDAGYRFKIPRYDQTLTPVSESAIEFILRKLEPTALSTRSHSHSPFSASQDSSVSPDSCDSSPVCTAEVFKNNGNNLLTLGLLEAAVSSYRKALELKPDYAEVYNNLGNVLRLLGRLTESGQAFLEALRLMPDNSEIYNNYGTLLMDLNQTEAAEKVFRQIIVVNPDYSLAYLNRGNALRTLGKLSVALKCYRHALQLMPESLESCIGLGQSLLHLGEIDEAEQSFLQALNIKSDYPEAYNGLGNIYLKKGFIEEAEKAYLKSIALKPVFPAAQFNLSILKLLKGELKDGFKLYEIRFSGGSPLSFDPTKNLFKQLEKCKRWEGEDVKDKALLILTEQGFGDSIMMLRYLPLLEQYGFEHVYVYCEPALIRLFQSIDAVNDVFSKADPLPVSGFDCYCPMMSLPYLFNTVMDTIPNSVPYLHVSERERSDWQLLLENISGLKVGLAWAGNSNNLLDKIRSIPLCKFSTLADTEGVQFVSLQKGEQACQLLEQKWPLIDWMHKCQDFMDTAALIAELDLVITVDTAVAHLAGAVGKQVWLLNRLETEWRWMLDREDSPWYPTMKIFRQKVKGDWDSVINEVGTELMSRSKEYSA